MYELFERAPALIAVYRADDLTIEFVDARVRSLVGRDVVGMRLPQVVDDRRYLAVADAARTTGCGGRVRVRTARGPDSVAIEVSDFVQADSSTPRTHGGLGLGLAIVRAGERLRLPRDQADRPR